MKREVQIVTWIVGIILILWLAANWVTNGNVGSGLGSLFGAALNQLLDGVGAIVKTGVDTVVSNIRGDKVNEQSLEDQFKSAPVYSLPPNFQQIIADTMKN